MADVRALIAGQRYYVVQEFADYDHQLYPIGETWVFERTHFLPYEDGLTLHVSVHDIPQVYRLQ